MKLIKTRLIPINDKKKSHLSLQLELTYQYRSWKTFWCKLIEHTEIYIHWKSPGTDNYTGWINVDTGDMITDKHNKYLDRIERSIKLKELVEINSVHDS